MRKWNETASKKGSTQEKKQEESFEHFEFFPFMAFREKGRFSFTFYYETGKLVER